MPEDPGQRTAVAVAEAVSRIIRRCAWVIPETVAITPDLELLEAGVDSITLVEIIAGLEMEFDCTFSSDQITFEAFHTPAAIASTVASVMSATP